jgi:hypothetical protein
MEQAGKQGRKAEGTAVQLMQAGKCLGGSIKY